jgi:hypothetical protein
MTRSVRLVPVATSARKAEWLWNNARRMLEHRGFPTEPRRLAAVYFRRGFDVKTFQLGVEDPETGEETLFIFRAAGAPFYWVLSPSHGLFGGAPIPVPDREGTWAVEFGKGEEGPLRRQRRQQRRPSGAGQ